MSSGAELEKFTMALPESQRASLAAHILQSLPAPLQDDDAGVTEALRRDAELDSNPALGISFEDFDLRMKSRRC
jgi:hypothetical protein